MAKAIVMPKPGMTVDECILSKWHKSVGDSVAKGELLFSYETDKASFDEPSEETGELLAVFYAEGDDVPALGNICVIGQNGEDVSAFAPDGAAPTPAPTPAANTPTTSAPSAPVAATSTSATSGECSGAVSPRAKNLAEKNGICPCQATGTGPNGRVIERDIMNVMANGVTAPAAVSTASISTASAPAEQPKSSAPTATGDFVDIPHSNVRKVIAKAMHASLSGMAQLTMSSSFDATEILSLRASFKKSENERLKGITLNDMVLFATARTLTKYKNMNANYYDDVLRVFDTVNLGVAVDTEKGLLVPKVMGADRLSLSELSNEAKSIATAAQNGRISPDLLAGGTFTVTNLGNLGIENFTPVINPPEVGILGVCNMTQRVKTVDSKITTYPAMGLSLTFDHRALDGAPAARFLKELCESLANFSVLLV